MLFVKWQPFWRPCNVLAISPRAKLYKLFEFIWIGVGSGPLDFKAHQVCIYYLSWNSGKKSAVVSII